MTKKKSYLPATITKQIEIDILWELFQKETYFKNDLTDDDLMCMSNNINNDFPLFMRLPKNLNLIRVEEEKIQKLIEDQKEINEKYKLEIQIKKSALKEMALALLLLDNDHVVAYTHLDHKEIVQIKFNNGIKMTDFDMDYIGKELKWDV